MSPDKKITVKPSLVENGEEKMAKALDCLPGQVHIIRTTQKDTVGVSDEPTLTPTEPTLPTETVPTALPQMVGTSVHVEQKPTVVQKITSI